MIIEFMPGVPAEIRDAVTPVLKQYCGYLPPHVRCVTVDYDSNQGVACINGKEEYGIAKIWVKSQWLTCSAREREESIVHELVHAILFPLAHFIEGFVQDNSSGKHLSLANQVLHDKLEDTTQCLAESMMLQEHGTHLLHEDSAPDGSLRLFYVGSSK